MNYIAILISTLMITTSIFAIPNIWDPKNIIGTKDNPYWFFLINNEIVQTVKQHPTVAQELIQVINWNAENYIQQTKEEISRADLSEKERKDLKETIRIIDKNRTYIINELDPQSLSEEDRSVLTRIIEATPEDLFNLDKKELEELLFWVGFHHPYTYTARVQIEKENDRLRAFIDELEERSRLSQKDKELIKKANMALKQAYTFARKIPNIFGHIGDSEVTAIYKERGTKRIEEMLLNQKDAYQKNILASLTK